MAKKISLWKTKGMNRDLSVSAFNPEFAFENINLRLSTNEDNTLMSWVNEKGTKKIEKVQIQTNPWVDEDAIGPSGSETPIIDDTIKGIPLGTAVLNHNLVIFTWSNIYDNIYVLRFNSDHTLLFGERIYHGHLKFNPEYPIETLVSYETDVIQKVYWTDGLNQPRVINISPDAPDYKKKLRMWNHGGNPASTVDTYFDFVPDFSISKPLDVLKDPSGNGSFAPGVIQYCYTYVNKYGQQTNIVDVSPLYYLSHSDRGASADTTTVTNSFTITIEQTDTSFDYVRLYSIQRTSLDSEAYVKVLEDIPTSTGEIKYVDNGTSGYNIAPTDLFYVGGKSVTALTMTVKDATLFLGNLSEMDNSVKSIQEYFDNHKPDISFITDTSKTLEFERSSGFYAHTNQLNQNSRKITTFKGGEVYRFGFQLQRKNGEWTEPIYLDDVLNTKYPDTSVLGDNVRLPYAQATINLNELDLSDYQKARPLVVFPNIVDRNVICQGVLNPTVFNVEDRKDNSPYAQASWYFRPYMMGRDSSTSPISPPTVTDEDYTSQYLGIDINFQDTAYTNVYVLVTDVPVGSADYILSKGYLTVEKIDDSSRVSQDDMEFNIGAIKLAAEASGGYIPYAFLSTNDWAVPKTATDENPASVTYTDPIANIRLSMGVTSQDSNIPDAYKMYDGMRRDAEAHTLFYPIYNDIQYYHFYFCVNTNDSPSVTRYYVVTFTGVNDVPYVPSSTNKSGGIAEFLHYASIPTQDDATQGNGNLLDVEIQGSIRSYDNPYSTTLRKHTYKEFSSGASQIYQDITGNIPEHSSNVNSNTQFFIDQSIVTLNSPDLEFDSMIQVHHTDNPKLRIIGVIPITASASSHAIKAGSAMLETNHNITKGNPEYVFGKGETDINIRHRNVDIYASRRLVSQYLWEDTFIKEQSNEVEYPDGVSTEATVKNYLIFPWHRNGSLNNDFRTKATASSWLETKKESNMMYSINTEYLVKEGDNGDIIYPWQHEALSAKTVLTENTEVMNYRLKKQRENNSSANNGTVDINYYPNIDKVLYNSNQYRVPILNIPLTDDVKGSPSGGELQYINKKVTTPVSMKYLSTSHAVIALQHDNSSDLPNQAIEILPKAQIDTDTYLGAFNFTGNKEHTFWGEDNLYFNQQSIDLSESASKDYGFLWLAELYKDVDENNRFGGKSPEALKANNWLIAGESVEISGDSLALDWTEGDTYYQRYDCMKTYPLTRDDSNQLVEILSFMCETHVNIDGRYDLNRGQIKNYDMRPDVFNLLNPVYTQRNNFFVSKKGDNENRNFKYPNQLYYSKSKQSGADVDLWTNVTLASILELDGDKGKLNKLLRFNDQIVAFQDTGISHILYNENVQISTQQGVPVELANSGKVQGKRYLSNTVGCSNKWSVVTTPSGVYFIDSVGKDIYQFTGQLRNISQAHGFNTWSKENIPYQKELSWNPLSFSDFVTYYDRQNQDVLFINKDICLAYSEKLDAFISFYDYGNTPYFCNLEGVGLWLGKDLSSTDDQYYLWMHQAGDYCKFFNVSKPYSMTLIGNQEPQMSKIFTNLEFRACVDEEGIYQQDTGKFSPTLPFDTLEVWNEYQHGITKLKDTVSHLHDYPLNIQNSLKRKFRMWRCDIPRDNCPVSPEEQKRGIYRFKAKPLDRMRNPWIYLKLLKEADTSNKVEIHDLLITYFI